MNPGRGVEAAGDNRVHARGDAMKAIVQDRYGSPDVLELREIDRPVNGDDQVLVRVHAAGVDQGVWHEVAGLPYLFRIAGIGVRAPKNPIPGHAWRAAPASSSSQARMTADESRPTRAAVRSLSRR